MTFFATPPKVPVFIENDATSAALAELVQGAGAREPLFEWIEDCANALVEAIIAITSVIDIEAIVLDSILPRSIHLELLAKVQNQFNRVSAIGIVAPEIIPGQFGPEASPIGAAMLPFSALLAPDSSVLMIGKDRTKLLGSLSALAGQG
jgi:predicted NBD/HSP70 family sugar kinase